MWSGAGLCSQVLGVPVTQLFVSTTLSPAAVSPSPLGPLGFIKPVQLWALGSGSSQVSFLAVPSPAPVQASSRSGSLLMCRMFSCC